MSDDKTVSKTLWSETLIDVLIVALKKNSSDAQIREILQELNEKGFKTDYLIDKVTREMDSNSAQRVRQLATR